MGSFEQQLVERRDFLENSFHLFRLYKYSYRQQSLSINILLNKYVLGMTW